jgi:hypothetical protein
MLPTMLGGLFVVFFATFLILITGGFFFYVLLVVGGVALLSWIHYELWGRALSQRTAGEREEMELLERAKAEETTVPRRDEGYHR